MNRFIDLADLQRDEILDLLALAQRLQDRPEPAALAGRILGLLFFDPSLRTLSSMQAGMARLGGQSVVISPGQGTWRLEWRDGAVMNGNAAEHVREGIPVLASYCDALGIRAFADGSNLTEDLAETRFMSMADLCEKPLINLESAMNHPCQALADWRTLDQLQVAPPARFVLSWVHHPRALPLAVPAATLTMAAQRGMEVVVLRPEGYALPEPLMAKARRLAEVAGGSVSETDDRGAAMVGAQVLYAKEWGSALHYGNAEAEAALRARHSDWMVTEDWFAGARRDCRFMHCLPVRRNVAVADAVLDGARSVVRQEAHNRMVVQMAVLHRLLARRNP